MLDFESGLYYILPVYRHLLDSCIYKILLRFLILREIGMRIGRQKLISSESQVSCIKIFCFLAIICLTLFSCRKPPIEPIRPEEIPPLVNKKIMIESDIPEYVRLDTLSIKGRAIGYDTLICDTRVHRIREMISDSGFFTINVPVLIDQQNNLSIFAKDQYNRSSDTTTVSFVHTLNNSIQLQLRLPHYTNQDPLSIRGFAMGFSTITCLGGAEIAHAMVVGNYFDISVHLKNNQVNHLLLFAEDSLGVISDTLKTQIIHDNIPPALVKTSVLEDSVSYNVNTPFEFEFDGPLLDVVLDIGVEGFDHIPPELIWEKEGISFHTSNPQLVVGLNYRLAVSASDSAGNRLDRVFPIKTYYRDIHLEQSITTTWLSQLLDRLYLLISNPKSLVVIDTRSWQIQKTIPLSYLPTRGAENPYNEKIYITSESTGYITVVDLEQAREIAFLLPEDESNSESAPYGIAFANNGMGIVQTGQWQVQMIDSRDGNRIYKHQDFGQTGSIYPTPVASNRYENLILVGMGGSDVDFYGYNYQQDEFHEILQDHSFDYCHAAIGHSFRAVIAFQVGRKSYVLDGEDKLFGPTSIERPFSFTHIPGEDHYLYFYDYYKSALVIYDVENDNEVESDYFGYRALPSGIIATSNGEYIVFIYDDNGALLIVEPKTFRNN